MNDGELLLRAILIDPADDGVRLVYADWLQEHGQGAEAQFIRTQVGRGVPFYYDCAAFRHGRDSPRRRLAERLVAEGLLTLFVSRGFVEGVELPCELFLARAAELFSSQPITSVRLRGLDPTEIGGAWNWIYGSPEPESPWFVPHDLWELIDLPVVDVCDRAKSAPTYEAAREALSPACVAYGRELAGLPPLPFPKEPPR